MADEQRWGQVSCVSRCIAWASSMAPRDKAIKVWFFTAAEALLRTTGWRTQMIALRWSLGPQGHKEKLQERVEMGPKDSGFHFPQLRKGKNI